MYIDLKRHYKSNEPQKTVSRIKGILKRIEINTQPIDQLNPYNGISSLSIYLENIGLTSRGKGMNEDYALASGYAEFMERIQNDASRFLGADRLNPYKKLFEKFGWIFYPDEKEITKIEFEDTINEILGTNFFYEKEKKSNFETAAMLYKNRIFEGSYEARAIPFIDTKNLKKIFLPLQFIYNVAGSNGMCAGNNPEEALCQGLFEIIERYASRRIFFERLTPPDVPSDFLSNFDAQMSIIKDIQEKEGIEITVKDFSGGIGLPAVGIILKSKSQNTYHVHCAGETSFTVGLHRCLTETYQNQSSAKIRLKHQVPEKEYEYMEKDDYDSVFLKYKNWIDWVKFGGGAFPKSVLDSTASYSFNKETFITKNNYKSELRNLIQIFWKLGYNVYIRDNSFLGFPSYMIYIPYISHDSEDYYGAITYYSRQKILNIALILLNQKSEELKKLLHELELQPSDQSIIFHYYYGQIKTTQTPHQIEDNSGFLQAMLYFYFESFEKCLKLIKDLYQKYLNSEIYFFGSNLRKSEICFDKLSPKKTESFFEIIIAYVKGLLNDKNVDLNSILMEKSADRELIDKAKSMFTNKNQLLEQINIFPVCPNCKECKIFNICGTKNAPAILEKVLSNYKISNLTDLNCLLVEK